MTNQQLLTWCVQTLMVAYQFAVHVPTPAIEDIASEAIRIFHAEGLFINDANGEEKPKPEDRNNVVRTVMLRSGSLCGVVK